MTGTRRSSSAAQIYVAMLVLVLCAALGAAIVRGGGFDHNMSAWLFLVSLFALLELADLLFHHEGDREGLSSSESVFLPLMVGFTFAQAVWGVVIAIGFASIADRRVDAFKGSFNVANLGCAAAASAGLWHLLREPSASLTPRNTAVAVGAVLVFAILTHVFVSIVISLVRGKRFSLLSGSILPALGWNLAGNISLGIFLAATALHSMWLVLLFPLPLAFLHFGYRAVVHQGAERQRVEKLLAASRALAASPSLEEALAEFLKSVTEIASSAEARVVVDTHRNLVWSAVKGGEVTEDLVPLDDGPMRDLLTEVERRQKAVIVTSDPDPSEAALLGSLGVRSLLAVPLIEGDAVVGCLVAIDRVGVDQFGRSEARLLEALGHELVLTLDSYRLFAEVSEEREKFRRIFTASKEGICLLDDRGAVRAWNPALARISGYESIEVIGRSWSERVVIRDRNSRRVNGMALLERPPEEELELVSRDGPSRWVSILSSPVQGAQEKGWVVLVRDVTAEHLVEEAKSDFLSTVSHELRTPLTTIKGSVSMLQRGKDTLNDAMYDRMVDVMLRGTGRLERLVLNLLFVSQVDADGSPKVVLEDFDMRDVVRERVAEILRDHPFNLEFPDDDPIVVRADRERLGQVVEHLVENAAKFDPDGEVQIVVDRQPGTAQLTVRDQGPGIAKADQARVFERFVRLGDVLTRQTQGPGVGLFIVKKAAEAMGGQVWIESSMGEGATFHVSFPLAQPTLLEGGLGAPEAG